jgi:hypothetical protein
MVRCVQADVAHHLPSVHAHPEIYHRIEADKCMGQIKPTLLARTEWTTLTLWWGVRPEVSVRTRRSQAGHSNQAQQGKAPLHRYPETFDRNSSFAGVRLHHAVLSASSPGDARCHHPAPRAPSPLRRLPPNSCRASRRCLPCHPARQGVRSLAQVVLVTPLAHRWAPCTGVELHNDKLHSPSSKVTLHWKRMLQAYVSGVSNICCKCFVSMLQK